MPIPMPTTKRDQTIRTGNRYHLPLPTGPYPNIGYFDLMTGTDKSDGVLFRLLYPAMDQNIDPQLRKERAKEWPNWFPHDNYRTGYVNVAQVSCTPVVQVMSKLLPNVFIPILENVDPLKDNEKSFPVIIFSHGIASCRTTYSNICYELASYGFIVFVVEHRDQTACSSFYRLEDGSEEWVEYKYIELYVNDLEIRNEQLNQRVVDIKRTISLLNDLQNGNQIQNVLKPQIDYKKFSGIFDMKNIIVMGHSFGSATAIRSLLTIDCIQLGICLDAWMYPIQDIDASRVTKPLLFVNMQSFQIKENLKIMKQYIGKDGKNTGQRKVVTIKEAKHTDQSDIPFILGSFMLWLLKMQSKVNPFVVHDVTTALTLEFIGQQLQMKLQKDKKEFIEEFQNHLIEGIDGID